MRLLAGRLAHEEQMFPNWHFCCPGVYITAHSFFAFCVDIESETPTATSYSLGLYNGAVCSRPSYPPGAAICCTKAAVIMPGRGASAQQLGQAGVAGDRRGLIAGCGGRGSNPSWLPARRERRRCLLADAFG